MIKLRFFAVLAILALILSLPTVASAQETPPHVFVGTAWQDGLVAPFGTEVTAWINGEIKGYTMVADATGKYDPLFVVRGNGTLITFKIGERPADQVATWEKGGANILDLTVNSNFPGPGPGPLPAP